jgi:hypothetical protein
MKQFSFMLGLRPLYLAEERSSSDLTNRQVHASLPLEDDLLES